MTPDDALANRAIDLTQLGAGSQHILHYDLGKNTTVNASLAAPSTTDYVPPSVPVAQVASLTLSGTYEVGDVVTIVVQNKGVAGANSKDLTYTATSSNLTVIRDGIINLINTNSGVGSGSGSYLQATAGTAAGVKAIKITAKTAGHPFLVNAAATNGAGATNLDRTQDISVESVTQNVTPPNQLNKKLSLTNAPASLGNLSTVQLSSGLLQTSTNALIGAQAFLTESNILIKSDGSSVASTVSRTLQPGDVLYVETTTSGITTGNYRRYEGSSAWSGTASELRTALTSQSANSLANAGPLLQLIRPGSSTTDYRLQSTTLGTPNLKDSKLATRSGAGLSFVVQTAAVVFNPATSVDNSNNTLTLTGLGANTGDLITYRVDPNHLSTIQQTAFLPITSSGMTNGSNTWSGITLPSTAAPTSANSGIYKLTYYSSNPLFASTGRAPAADPIGGLLEGQVLYAKVGTTSGTIKLFRNDAATQALNLNASDTSANTTHYFKLDVNFVQSSQAVGGISPNEELLLIALGGDRYQLVEDNTALENALPHTLKGSQISDTTQLSKVVDDEVNGVEIKSEIKAENAVEAETGIGGEPALNDRLSMAGASTLMAKGLTGVMKQLFQIDINPAKTEVEQGSSISGAIALNLGEHIASVEQGSAGNIVANSSKPVEIGSSIEATFKNINKSETEQLSAAAVNVSLGVNNLSNTAKNTLRGSIQTSGEVTLEATTEYPSLFMETFGDAKKIRDWFKKPTNILDSISDVTGAFIGESFNSFSRVKIAGGEDDDGNDQTAEIGIGISLNVNKITTANTNIIVGRISAGDLTLNASNQIDFIRGAGSIHIDLSPETLVNFGRGYMKEGSANRKDLLSAGNVAKNGLGASVSIITPVNTTQNIFAGTSVVTLSGALEAAASQSGKSVGVAVGSGSSSNLGFNGGILVETGASNTTENVRNAGARLQAASASFTATDELAQADFSGAVQFSKSIGMGLSLILNDLQRKTRNRLDASDLTLSGDDGLQAVATNTGDLLTIAVAGAISTSAKSQDPSMTAPRASGCHKLLALG